MVEYRRIDESGKRHGKGENSKKRGFDRAAPQGRGVRFDVFARDSKGREYDIEIQRANDGAEPKRARYNSSLMDANTLNQGDDFVSLRDTYVIFITENDTLGGDKEVYHIDRTVRELEGKPFNDGTHIIYVNGGAAGDFAADAAVPTYAPNTKSLRGKHRNKAR